jgi:radical SAM superfamily enzyme YgiQ (UPF0313 family)
VRVHLISPNYLSFGIGVVTPRWMFVIAAATPRQYGDPHLVDESLEPLDPSQIQAGDVVGIGIHTANAYRGYQIGRVARERGAYVVFGGIHSTLYPEEAYEHGGAHAVVRGDGDAVWSRVLADCANGGPKRLYEGGLIEAGQFLPARWDLLPPNAYMWGSVQTVRGCPKHCSFCSVWKTDGQRPRQRASDPIIEEIVELRRRGYSFILLADDNFYPVTLEDLRLAERQNNPGRLAELRALRRERFELMARLAQMPRGTYFFTQITMEAADDLEFLEAMRKARIKGALVGVESVTAEGLKAVYKDFNSAGDELVRRLRAFRENQIHVLGSFIFGLPTDRPETFQLTAEVAKESEMAFAQFVLLRPYPGTVDFQRWEKKLQESGAQVAGVPLSRYWLIPDRIRPRLYTEHPQMSAGEILGHTKTVWENFYSLPVVWKRSRVAKKLRSRLAFTLISKLYLHMFANTGIATDSARTNRAATWARWLAKPCLRLFRTKPMPDLQVPPVPPELLADASQPGDGSSAGPSGPLLNIKLDS